MATLIEALRSGRWLTRERVRLMALALLAASVLGIVYVAGTSDGLNDRFGRPLGTDFANVYAAGTYVLEGDAAASYEPHRQYEREQAIFGPDTQFYGWHYPPFFLALAGLFATMPYWLALALWQGATLALYLAAIRAVLQTSSWPGVFRPSTSSLSDRPPDGDARHKAGHDADEPALLGDKLWFLLALAYPAVFINLGHGHNGFLTAALFAGALAQIDRRPLIAGILFGLIAYKPQFGLLVPLVLAATGRWRVFVSAALTVTALVLAVTLAFGTDVWAAFLASMTFTRDVVLEQGGTGWYKIQSVFSWVRMWGGSVDLAYAVQAAVTLAIAAGLVRLWRSRAPFAVQGAALLIGTVLATPYVLDYDLMLLAPAIAWLAVDGAQRGFGSWYKTMLAALWLLPLFARTVAQNTALPLAVPLMLAAFTVLLCRTTPRAKTAAAHRIPAE